MNKTQKLIEDITEYLSTDLANIVEHNLLERSVIRLDELQKELVNNVVFATVEPCSWKHNRTIVPVVTNDSKNLELLKEKVIIHIKDDLAEIINVEMKNDQALLILKRFNSLNEQKQFKNHQIIRISGRIKEEL